MKRTHACVPMRMASFSFEIDRKRKRPTREVNSRKLLKKDSTHSDTNSPSTIKELEDSISDSSKNFNNVVILLKLAKRETKSSNAHTPALFALCRVFCRLHAQGWLSNLSAEREKAQLVTLWLRTRYKEYRTILLELLCSPTSALQEVVMALAMELVREECASSYHGDITWKSGFFAHLLKALLSMQEEGTVLESLVNRYLLPYDDVRHYALQNIENMFKTQDRSDLSLLVTNSLGFLSRVPTKTSHEIESPNLFVSNCKLPSYITRMKQMQRAWMAILNAGLDQAQREAVLGYMTLRILPWFQDVELLMDFLTDSYNYGGATSLLALSGMFHLMQEKNLDYPEFYTKLYSLLNDELLSSKYRSRFFRLFNTFMSSTHLPAALVASFVKKLSRLALHSPPGGIVAVIPWIYNTLKAHPACTFMIHREPRTDAERRSLEEFGTHDPFDPDQKDPMGTCAIDSSLWELETLRSHYHPNVSSLAKIISEQFTKASYQIDDFLDHSYKTLLESEFLRELKKAPMVEYEIPKTVFRRSGNNDDHWERLLDIIIE